MVKKWEVVNTSAMYYDVAERVGLGTEVSKYAEPDEVAYAPVCRVHRHSRGQEFLDRILRLPEVEAEIERLRKALLCPKCYGTGWYRVPADGTEIRCTDCIAYRIRREAREVSDESG